MMKDVKILEKNEDEEECSDSTGTFDEESDFEDQKDDVVHSSQILENQAKKHLNSSQMTQDFELLDLSALREKRNLEVAGLNQMSLPTPIVNVMNVRNPRKRLNS